MGVHFNSLFEKKQYIFKSRIKGWEQTPSAGLEMASFWNGRSLWKDLNDPGGERRPERFPLQGSFGLESHQSHPEVQGGAPPLPPKVQQGVWSERTLPSSTARPQPRLLPAFLAAPSLLSLPFLLCPSLPQLPCPTPPLPHTGQGSVSLTS